MGARHFCPKNVYEKLTQVPEFYTILARKLSENIRIFMIFAGKISKIPEFHTIFFPKNARILHNNCLKNIFSRILGASGHLPSPQGRSDGVDIGIYTPKISPSKLYMG